jgi:uncharacterized protein (DUF2345 family)
MRIVQNERGNTLILAITLLAVLAAIGAAAVSLGSQERANATAKTHYDSLVACAAAAQMQMWAEAQTSGSPGAYFGSSKPIVSVNMPDGTKLVTPSHYHQAAGMTVNQVVFAVAGGVANVGVVQRDLTNSTRGTGSGPSPYRATARCIDNQQREYEVEISVAFPL